MKTRNEETNLGYHSTEFTRTIAKYLGTLEIGRRPHYLVHNIGKRAAYLKSTTTSLSTDSTATRLIP